MRSYTLKFDLSSLTRIIVLFIINIDAFLSTCSLLSFEVVTIVSLQRNMRDVKKEPLLCQKMSL